jgi:hypothetical protein
MRYTLDEQHILANDAQEDHVQERPKEECYSAHIADERMIGVAGLAVLAGQIAAYFNGRADSDDIDVVSFCLHHLFCCVDTLYRISLPDLLDAGRKREAETEAAGDQPPTTPITSMQDNYRLWLQLRTLKKTLNQVESFCHLLNIIIEQLLDNLDTTSVAASESQDTLPRLSLSGDNATWLQSLNQERWEHALSALAEILGLWQTRYSQMPLFAAYFAQQQQVTRIPTLERLDETFSIVLDCAGAIFGDIVPGFQAVSANDDEAVSTLLFDLMQQSDQLQLQPLSTDVFR